MQFKGMLLMCSALITLAYSFPTDLQDIITTMHQNDTNLLDAKENEKPLVLIIEEKDPKSDSVVVQFVYTSNGANSIVQSTGSEKDKYEIENPAQEEKKNTTSNENEKKNTIQIANIQKAAQRPVTERNFDASKIQMTPLSSLEPEEESPLSDKWPKYFYETFSPIKPFPELQLQNSNQIIKDKITKGNDETYILNNGKDRKDIPYAAGPPLNPLSIYDREFYVPIFD